jgi:hypothetical protein
MLSEAEKLPIPLRAREVRSGTAGRPRKLIGVASLLRGSGMPIPGALVQADALRAAHFGDHKKRIAPTSEPSTGANPKLPVPIASARHRVPALQHR